MISAESARDLVKNFDIWEKIRQEAKQGKEYLIVDHLTYDELQELDKNGYKIEEVILPFDNGTLAYCTKTYKKIIWAENGK